MPTSRRLLIVGSLLTLSAHAGARSKADEDSIGALLVAHTEKWNLHDIDAWAEILHDDADWVHWGGGYWRGKDAIPAGTKEIHRTYYRASRMTPQRVEDLTFLAPDIALAHVRSELTGHERAPGHSSTARAPCSQGKRDRGGFVRCITPAFARTRSPHTFNESRPSRRRSKTPVSLAQFFADSSCSRCRLRSRRIFPTSATKRG